MFLPEFILQLYAADLVLMAETAEELLIPCRSSAMSMKRRVGMVATSCFYHLHRLRQIRRHAGKKS